ncbi:hypothetical protein [Streptomyces sp. NPDC127033]|uniref:hypothetical protein n=1 Tax=Streptomyces sp. NPDC127033 TaxID=3347110 RepID=UPI0036679683
MPENTVTAPLAPMAPDGIASAFAYIRVLQAGDIDTACAVIEDTGGVEMRRLLLDVAARIFIPVTAVDDRDEEPCAHSFLAAALGRLLLEVLCHGDGDCQSFRRASPRPSLASPRPSSPRTTTTSWSVLRQLEAAGMELATEAHPVRPTIA